MYNSKFLQTSLLIVGLSLQGGVCQEAKSLTVDIVAEDPATFSCGVYIKNNGALHQYGYLNGEKIPGDGDHHVQRLNYTSLKSWPTEPLGSDAVISIVASVFDNPKEKGLKNLWYVGAEKEFRTLPALQEWLDRGLVTFKNRVLILD